MGIDKALLTIRGKPVIARIRDELKQAVVGGPAAVSGSQGVASGHEAEGRHKKEESRVPFVIVANDPAAYRFLGEKTVTDRYPGRGPLAGIEAGLRASAYEWNLVVACDMPLVTGQAGRFLLEQAVAAERPVQVDAVVPVIDGRLQPLFAVYHKRCADRIERLLQAEQLKMTDLLEQLRVKRVTEADFPAEIDTGRVFINMNRPDEYEQVQQMVDAGCGGPVRTDRRRRSRPPG